MIISSKVSLFLWCHGVRTVSPYIWRCVAWCECEVIGWIRETSVLKGSILSISQPIYRTHSATGDSNNSIYFFYCLGLIFPNKDDRILYIFSNKQQFFLTLSYAWDVHTAYSGGEKRQHDEYTKKMKENDL